MICLSLTAGTLAENLRAAARFAPVIDMVELRADFLLREQRTDLHRFPSALPAARDGNRLPAILTVRAGRDGGQWREGEGERRHLLLHGVRGGGYAWVDLEGWLRGSDAGLLEAAAAAGTTVIRSMHDFEGVPDDLAKHLDGAARPQEIPKAAVMPGGSADLLRFARALQGLAPRRRVVVAMGAVGFATRVLARRFGSMFTFCSPNDIDARVAAPGHVDPETMAGLYRYHSIDADTAVFGVIGNPVMHSQSPVYHNRRFAEDQLNAVYLPFAVDDVDAFFELADLIPVDGFSVTIPHKQAVMGHLVQSDASVLGAGACNTVVRRGGGDADGGWIGYNSDVEGFLTPLLDAASQAGWPDLRGRRATVIGAGGAARAVVYALLRRGVNVLLLNRTLDRAEALVRDLAGTDSGASGAVTCAVLEASAADVMRRYADVIVQTTSVGMVPDSEAEPIPFYRFSGHEIVYDIVYTPPVTRLLRRAADAGCTTIGGARMFAAQADAQYRLFSRLQLADRSPRQ
ncbi:MAG: type I 3-dehydroquinate dehydratase [Spirochaetaceae bacterium]|nr:MAG: type I 3-dehydroquinate dehydratase [Spirochaetaceae bacterium]